jgi:hypothetical protein
MSGMLYAQWQICSFHSSTIPSRSSTLPPRSSTHPSYFAPLPLQMPSSRPTHPGEEHVRKALRLPSTTPTCRYLSSRSSTLRSRSSTYPPRSSTLPSCRCLSSQPIHLGKAHIRDALRPVADMFLPLFHSIALFQVLHASAELNGREGGTKGWNSVRICMVQIR